MRSYRVLLCSAAMLICLVGVPTSSEAQQFVRGDVDNSGTPGLPDVIGLLNYLFLNGEIDCQDTGDLDDDGALGLTDAIYLLNYLFLSGVDPAQPFPDPGSDPTPDTLDCGECWDAELQPGINMGSTAAATDDYASSCGGAGAPDMSFLFTAGNAGVYIFQSFGSTFDTVLSVYDTDCVTELECNNDFLGIHSRVLIELEAGQQVVVVMDGATPGDSGDFTIRVQVNGNITPFNIDFMGLGADILVTPGQALSATVDYTAFRGPGCPGCLHQLVFGLEDQAVACLAPYGLPAEPTPFTDMISFTAPTTPGLYQLYHRHTLEFTCTDALANYTVPLHGSVGSILVADGEVVLGTNTGSTLGGGDDFSGSCGLGLGEDLALSFTAGSGGLYTFNTAGTTFDTMISILDAQGNELGCNDDPMPGELQARIGVYLEPGQTAVVMLDGYWDYSVGDYTLEVGNLGGVSGITTDLNGLGNAATVTVGEPVSLTVNYSANNGSNCPTCIHQMVIGYATETIGCQDLGILGATATPFTDVYDFTAPTTPGTYEIFRDHTLEFSCAGAVANYAPDGEPIAVLTVLGL